MIDLDMPFNVWLYLAQVAPVVLVMGIAIAALWHKNDKLIDDMKRKDEANLLTLQNIAVALENIQGDSKEHVKELKAHVDDRISTLRTILGR